MKLEGPIWDKVNEMLRNAFTFYYESTMTLADVKELCDKEVEEKIEELKK